MTGPLYWVNGDRQATLPLDDRAILYGDGLFETLRIRAAKAEFLDRHLQRLAAGCKRLCFPDLDWQSLRDEIGLCAAQRDDGVLKLIVSRGSGGRGYRIDPAASVTRIVSILPLPEWPAHPSIDGIRARICQTPLAIQPLLAGIKHLNRLEQVLARAEWHDPAVAEGLMLAPDGRLVEGTMSNVFLVHDGVLKTPELSQCGIAGVMRSVVLDCAKVLGLGPRIETLTLEDVGSAQEMFVCNSLIGIWPLVAIDDVYTFEVGPVTRRLQTTLETAGESAQGQWYSV
jgi:4-amino-4-deoxychorismate lyase